MAKPESNWWELAECQYIDPEIFFPVEKASTEPAKRICNNVCEVRQQCLEAALREEYGLCANMRFGVRGGLGAKGRYELARRRGEPVSRKELESLGEAA
ncbi:WhiB family transcription factor [Mycobacterium phage Finemlucis]|uniref:WhiB family transcription factor n=1 Tax=Mycobacterium phage Finemlucis TaxID=2015844 RepID=A0A291I9X1_9CAUD|nr:WhiB family transcription factor [Mycobacterium phage Finemlucis]ATG86491.1 WhiB family transcription factor [Mycobacterium phage Finemlucis]